MSLPIDQELRRIFELATLRREAQTIQSPRQWRRVQDLKVRCQDARVKEKDLYASRYDSRVEARRRQLIAEAGAQRRDFKPWWGGADRFNPADLLRQAQREVRDAHERRLVVIDDYERRQLKEVVERSAGENRMRGVARSAFARAVDRRVRPFER